MPTYIISSGFYRLSCGALILAINWMVVKDSNSLSSLAVLIACTFIPAIIVPLLWRNNKKVNGGKLTALSLVGAALLSLAIYFIGGVYSISILNTVLWFFFFVMESSWESWFTNICHRKPSQEIEKFSSLSMTVNQASLMIGPILAAFFFGKHPKYTLIICALIFLACSAIVFAVSKIKGYQSHPYDDNQKDNHEIKIRLTGVELSLLLVWPTLAMFNFMLPAQISHDGGSMAEVGILDALMGGGMIASGVLLSKEAFRIVFNKYKISLLLIFIALAAWYFYVDIYHRSFSVFLLGMAFNSARIYIRSNMAMRYNEKQVGKIVSTANSFSFFIISLSLILFYDNYSVSWAIPYIYCGLICLVLMKLNKNKLYDA